MLKSNNIVPFTENVAFYKCRIHYNYRGVKPPRTQCAGCYKVWNIKQDIEAQERQRAEAKIKDETKHAEDLKKLNEVFKEMWINKKL